MYDPHGNLLYKKDHVYENGQYKNTQTIGYTYTPTHQIKSLTRASDIKHYTYDNTGKVKTKTLPDGIVLSYEYNPLGYLTCLKSSDGKIHHTFASNNLGHLTYTEDVTQNIAIKRMVDPFGNVTQEIFPSGLTLQ